MHSHRRQREVCQNVKESKTHTDKVKSRRIITGIDQAVEACKNINMVNVVKSNDSQNLKG